MSKIQIKGDLAYLEGPEAIVQVPEIKETEQYLKPSSESSAWAPWGDANNRPSEIIEKVEANVIASSGLEFLVDAFFGSGLMTYRKIIEGGKEIFEPVIDKNFEEFKANNDFEQYLEESIYDFIYFKNIFPEMALNKFGKNKIVNMWSKEAFACRWARMDEKSYKIPKLYFSYEWPKTNDDYITPIDVFDPQNPQRFSKFIYRVPFASVGRKYYAKPPWHSVVDSGWLDISNNIPTVKQSLLKNNMSLKYHIRIPKNYWQDKYKDWDSKSPEAQKDIRTEELTDLNNMLTGQENVMKSFISHYGVDKHTGKELPGWEILKIDNKIEDGILSTDQTEANAMILFALNIDPTLKGQGLPNSKQSAGSGSDKRTAYNIFKQQFYRSRQRFLAPLYFIKKFNGWDENLYFGFKDQVLTTLDENPTSTEKVINS